MEDAEEYGRSLETITRDHEVFLEGINSAALNKFKQEVSELFTVFSSAFTNTSNLERKVQELSEEHQSILDLVGSKTETTEETKQQAESIRKQNKAALERVQTLTNQGPEVAKQVETVTAQNEDLEREIAKGSGWTKGQESSRTYLQQETVTEMRNLESKTKLLAALRKDIARAEELVDEQYAKERAIRESIRETERSVSEKRDETRGEQGKKFEIEESLQNLQQVVLVKRTKVTEQQGGVKLNAADISVSEGQLKVSKERMEKYLAEYDSLFRSTQKLTETLDKQLQTNEDMRKANEARVVEIGEHGKEAERTAKESENVVKAKRVINDKIAAAEEERQKHEKRSSDLNQQITSLNARDIKSEKKVGEQHRKALDDAKREKEILTRKLGASERTASLIFDLSKLQENAQKNLTNEIAGLSASVKEQRVTLEQLKVERDRHAAECKGTHERYLTVLEEVRLQEVQVTDLQRKIVDGGGKLKQQQNLYEAVRSDRNLYSKNLIESQEEIAEMKRRFKVMNHQIEQLKDEIQSKDHTLVKEHFNHHKVEKEKEQLKNELTKIRKQIVSSDQIISNQKAEIEKLGQIIQEADEEKARQEKELGAIVSERNILQGQLVKRQEELGDVYEKIKVHWSTLQHGEHHYQKMLAEIDFLREKIVALRTERDNSSDRQDDLRGLKGQVASLEKDLLHERAKIGALSEELSRPMNMHRWRVLESSDPQRLELVRKVQNLQKQMVTKTEEVVEKDLLIQEKEKLYVELKNVIGRQPGPEVAEQISVYQSNLKQKVQQMKAMNNELDMYKQQVEEFKDEINAMLSEQVSLKNEWIGMRSKGGIPAAIGEESHDGSDGASPPAAASGLADEAGETRAPHLGDADVQPETD